MIDHGDLCTGTAEFVVRRWCGAGRLYSSFCYLPSLNSSPTGRRKHLKVGTATIGPKAVDGGEYRGYICQRSSHVHIILHGKIARSSQAPLHVWILLCKRSYHEKMYAMPRNTGTQDIVRPHTRLKVDG